MTGDYRDNVCFILVRPAFLGNIGAVARLMKNFGYSNLRLVSPPRNYKDAEARKMAVGAFDILKKAEVFNSLKEALSDISLAAGTTSGRQRTEKLRNFVDVSTALAQAAVSNMVAVVFGDERDGLKADELSRCHLKVTIPTEEALPSLNLAQCAAVVAYELSRTWIMDPACRPEQPVQLSRGLDDDEIIARLDELINLCGFSRTYNRDLVLSELRNVYQRMLPTQREADLIKGALIRINQSLKKSDGQS